MKIQFEHVDTRFKQMAESFDTLGERMDRRFDAVEQNHQDQMALLKDVLMDHGRRIRGLEKASSEREA